MAENKIRIEDHSGNVYYPHTKSDVVFMENGQTLSAQMADKANKDDLVLADKNIEEIEKQLENYNSYASQKDNNGVFTVVDYKRADTTLYMKSTLSNPDVDENYQTMTWELYNDLGTVVEKTIIWNITYDADGDIVNKVVAQ